MSTLYIGLMSGTSLDGVDGVLADISAAGIQTLAAAFTPFPEALRAELLALQAPTPNEIEREALAANGLARVYADCVRSLVAQAPGPIRAVAVHGQTIRHRPELGFTRQTNNPALLAELCRIDVVADFRARDVAAGGQGAPLVPAFHQALFWHAGEERVLLNVGGIANISILRADGQVLGFDTGPGNVLMDGWIARHQGAPFDRDGAWAATGQVQPALLQRLLSEPYFAQPAPKSTGRDLFHMDWLDAMLAHAPGADPADVMATLTALTAHSVARDIRQQAPHCEAVYVCGGGAYNPTLLGMLEQALGGQIRVASTAALGVAPNRVEALAFAWLGQRFLARLPGNAPAVTGAAGPRLLGALYPA
ncbi:anhydro-N-acetylmuramic acid kinase [Massilia sp. TS11]|uniref:anhydro-N-acetylmuramic acid kinase n=1 Tax=Massilia sp. TS11 TaxID=2908003 RepID=UPI001EDA5A30|nr:anhydro-N-acetylmuramic acid kinase [Massilia sp. TS11]MCG2585434.1 anhydro-N-acetylmuramic acid kinase [Massilia sp. TS11]